MLVAESPQEHRLPTARFATDEHEPPAGAAENGRERLAEHRESDLDWTCTWTKVVAALCEGHARERGAALMPAGLLATWPAPLTVTVTVNLRLL